VVVWLVESAGICLINPKFWNIGISTRVFQIEGLHRCHGSPHLPDAHAATAGAVASAFTFAFRVFIRGYEHKLEDIFVRTFPSECAGPTFRITYLGTRST
jgi:hypothetical protein